MRTAEVIVYVVPTVAGLVGLAALGGGLAVAVLRDRGGPPGDVWQPLALRQLQPAGGAGGEAGRVLPACPVCPGAAHCAGCARPAAVAGVTRWHAGGRRAGAHRRGLVPGVRRRAGLAGRRLGLVAPAAPPRWRLRQLELARRLRTLGVPCHLAGPAAGRLA